MEISVVCAPRPPHPAAIWWLRMSPLRRTHSGSCRHSFAGGGGSATLPSQHTNKLREGTARSKSSGGGGGIGHPSMDQCAVFVCLFFPREMRCRWGGGCPEGMTPAPDSDSRSGLSLQPGAPSTSTSRFLRPRPSGQRPLYFPPRSFVWPSGPRNLRQGLFLPP